MLGLHARVDGVFFYIVPELFVAYVVELRARDGLRSVADYAELLRYGDGGVLVVAGYHYRADSRAAAFDYCGLDLGTHGVDHS